MGLKGKKGFFTAQRHLGIGRCKASALQDYQPFSLSAPSSMDEGYIYRGEEEVGIPTIVEGRPYPLGGSPYGGKKRPKEEGRGYSGETTPDDSSTKLL